VEVDRGNGFLIESALPDFAASIKFQNPASGVRKKNSLVDTSLNALLFTQGCGDGI